MVAPCFPGLFWAHIVLWKEPWGCTSAYALAIGFLLFLVENIVKVLRIIPSVTSCSLSSITSVLFMMCTSLAKSFLFMWALSLLRLLMLRATCLGHLRETLGEFTRHVYTYTPAWQRLFIQGVFNYPFLIFCTILLYNFRISCFLNDPIITFNFDEALI